MADDYKANTKTTGTVAVGGSATGVIEKARDADWFAVELVAGRTYVIDVEGEDAGGGTLTNAMRGVLYDSEGRRIARTRDDGAGNDARIVFTATETGTHYIAAKGPRKEDTGSYTVRVTPEDADAVAGGAIDLGDLVALDRSRLHRDSLDGGHDATDYYRFTLSETRKVKFKLQRQDADADLFLEDENGVVLFSSAQAGTKQEKIVETLEAGTYYVRVAAQEAGDNAYNLRYRIGAPPVPAAPPETALATPPEPASQTGSADLQQSVSASVSEPEGVDFPADTSTTGRVAVDGSVRGCIETSDDVDWFAVTLEKGKTYRFDLKGWGSGDNTLSNPWLRGIHDADGNLIPGTADNDSGGALHSRVYFTPKEGGTYYVAAGNDPFWHIGSDPNACIDGGTYTLSVTEFADDFGTAAATAGTVAVGGSATGTIDYVDYVTDRDWFAVTLEKGKTYRFDLKGSDTGDGTLEDPWLSGIHDADGNLIVGTWNNNGGTGKNSRVFFTATEDATYYVAAAGYVSHTGTYTLAVTDITNITDDFSADTDTTGTLAVDGSVRGEIETPDDIDWFAVTLEKGKSYRFDLKGSHTGDGTLDDPCLLGIRDADGNLIAGTTDDDGGAGKNSRVSFTPTETATYYVEATGYNSHTGTYTLAVEEAVDAM